VPAVGEATTKAAIGGDRAALEAVVRTVRDDVYRLAHRMLWHPQDAEDATQEILIRVVTRLSTLRGDAQLRTWAHRIAINYLLTTRKRRMEREALSFDAFWRGSGAWSRYGVRGAWRRRRAAGRGGQDRLHAGLAAVPRPRAAGRVHPQRDLRVAGEEAAAILEITPAAYRKRAQRARDRIQAFMRGHCGMLDAANPCRCERRVDAAIAAGRVDPRRLLFVREQVRRIERFQDAAAVYRSHPEQRAPERVVAAVLEAVA
jgi:DNA-directed RNA polymerase specialized sigma24 family protein